MVAAFMGSGAGVSVNAANVSVGVEDDLTGLGGDGNGNGNGNGGGRGRGGRFGQDKRDGGSGGAVKVVRQFFQGLFGGGRGGGGGEDSQVATETNVAAMAGNGASSGLPTCADDGSIEMVFHQVSCSVKAWMESGSD